MDFRSHIKYSQIFCSNVFKSAVVRVVSHTILDRDGNPNAFNLNSDGDELKLNGNNTNPDNRWNADNSFVFCLRKSSLFHTHRVWFFLSGFSRLFFQPPNILPTSSSFWEIPAY